MIAYSALLILPLRFVLQFSITHLESCLNDGKPYIIHAHYHRLARHIVLLASLPTDFDNASRASQCMIKSTAHVNSFVFVLIHSNE